MIKKYIDKIFLLITFFSLFSCTKKDNNLDVLNNYIIKKSDILNETKIYQLSDAVSSKNIDKIDINESFIYISNAIFFESDCIMNENELSSFLLSNNYTNFKFEDNKYKCIGTNYYSYNKREKVDKLEYTIETANLNQNYQYALFYISDLQKYKITSKINNISFNLYISVGSFIISLEQVLI